jgi:hypothetical protein
MAPHWKCGSGQPVAGSNPALSATLEAPISGQIPTRWEPSTSKPRSRDRFQGGGSWARKNARFDRLAPTPTLPTPAHRPRRPPRAGPTPTPWESVTPWVPWRDNSHPAGICRPPRRAGHEPAMKPSLLSSRSRARRGTSGALNLQSAPAGLNSHPRSPYSNATASSDVEDRVPRSGDSRTVSGPEGSSTKRSSSGAAERPGPSRSSRRARDNGGRRWVHGTSSSPEPRIVTVTAGAP